MLIFPRCSHCGDFTRGGVYEGKPCCEDCLLELIHGIIPDVTITNSAPHHPKGVLVRSKQRMPHDADEDYFGTHDRDVDGED